MRTLSILLAISTAALGTARAAVTQPDQIKVPPGFKVELLREAGPDEGSWICMAQDDKGRLYLSPQGKVKGANTKDQGQWGGIWRVTLGKSAQSSVPSAQAKGSGAAGANLSTEHRALSTPAPWALTIPADWKWDRVPVPVADCMGMLWAFDSLYLSGDGPQGRGIYRCTSSKGDGNLDTATLFKAVPGGAGEHGAHAILLGPDKKLYIMHGNSTPMLDGLAPDSPYRNWGEDDLLPKLRDPVATFFDKIKAPYGCVYRTDENGTKWELFAGGFRNPYDIAFNADGELFTYDSDMEWDRGLPWYRPTRILHVVPGGEYGFREGSAKWPAYFPDSLPAVVDIGVGCPTGMTFGTDAKGWPEQYRKALFIHDWTYGRILAVHLHEKGASYTARNDLASYTYPRDAEANGDVEVFLSGKGMPVTDMEFLRDGSMVFTVGGRGTASALYRVSYHGPTGPDGQHGRREAGIGRPSGPASPEKRPSDRILSPGDIDGLLKTEAAPNQNAPEAQRKVAGGAASGASATTGSPTTNASAPDGAQENAGDRTTDGNRLRKAIAKVATKSEPSDEEWNLYNDAISSWSERDDRFSLQWVRFMIQGTLLGMSAEDSREMIPAMLEEAKRVPVVAPKELLPKARQVLFPSLLELARTTPASAQQKVFEALQSYPFASLPDDLKLLKLRVLELSFARQGRPSAEAVQALARELLAIYPAGGGAGAPRTLPSGTPDALPKDDAGKRAAERAFHPGAPVDDPAWRLNRELAQLLVWLTNPELGELNADLVEKAKTGTPAAPKSPVPAPEGKKSAFHLEKEAFSAAAALSSAPSADRFASSADRFASSADRFASSADRFAPSADGFAPSADGFAPSADGFAPSADGFASSADGFAPSADGFAPSADRFASSADGFAPSADGFAPSADRFAPSDLLFVQAKPLAGKAPLDPEKEADPRSRGALAPSSDQPGAGAPRLPAASLGPVPNPGASVFPGRKGADFHAELGRQVIEKTLALMDAAPSQEEQIHYALCLRWAHGWTPGQRVRYFRWFHEKAARYTGGNSFAKFVEAIRAEAASRVPESERAALAEWLRPVATPPPAAALKPRAFVKAWTLPELEAALDAPALKARKPDLVRGKELFTQAQCAQCHLFRDAGGAVGPDLTAVAQRFGRHDILESITDPGKVISDQYAMVTLTILDGKGGTAEVSGLVKDESSATITLLTDPLAGKTSNLYKNVVVKREKAAVSLMPPALLYTLTAEEVADLVGFLGAR